MSELSIEQKAKLYDEVIERAKKWYNAPNVDKIPTFGNRIIEDIFPELKEPEDEQIRKEILSFFQDRKAKYSFDPKYVNIDKWIALIEKQGQSKKTSIWKHWKNGIAGNGDGKLTFLIKSGVTYSLSSCLSFECDYIELSELDNLILEKQIEQNSNIPWHDVSEEPEEHREILCEWSAHDDVCQGAVLHDVVFYHADTKIFWDGEQQIERIVRWAYVDEMLEEQPQS